MLSDNLSDLSGLMINSLLLHPQNAGSVQPSKLAAGHQQSDLSDAFLLAQSPCLEACPRFVDAFLVVGRVVGSGFCWSIRSTSESAAAGGSTPHTIDCDQRGGTDVDGMRGPKQQSPPNPFGLAPRRPGHPPVSADQPGLPLLPVPLLAATH